MATSARYSPNISRLLAVDALRRAETPEAWSALGSLLLTDPRRPPDVIHLELGAAVNVVRFSPDGALLATGAGDGRARIYTTGTDEVVAQWRHTDAIESLVFANDASVLATASRDGTAVVADFGGSPVVEVEHDDQINEVALSADGRLVATASHDGTARVTDADGTFVELRHDGPVWSVDLTADGEFVATGTETATGGLTTLWAADGTQLATFEHDGAVEAVEFSPDDRFLFGSSMGTGMHLIDVDAAESIATPSAGGGIFGIEWRPDGVEVSTYSLGGAHRVLSPGGAALGRLNQAGGERGIAYDTSGEWAVVASGDFAFSFGVIGVWDLGTKRSLVELNTGGPIQSVAVSPDGRWIAAGNRYADGATVKGDLFQLAGREAWLDQACEGHDGIIDADRWAELVGPSERFIPGCPGVEPPPAPDVSAPDVSAPDVSTP